MASGLFQTNIKSLPLVYRGKVRDSYAVGDDKLLIVTTDRLSAFDVVMNQPIPDKGRVLNAMSNFWFEKLGHIAANHLTGIVPESVVAASEVDQVRDRAVVAMKLKPLPVEAVVRGYLIGSGWKDYQKSGEVCGIKLPGGLQMASRLPEPIFTPATKAETGHDVNISYEEAAGIVGEENAAKLRDLTLKIYSRAAEYALPRGIILADVKFEFGVYNGGIILCDELLTPDSSRFWQRSSYRPGRPQPSFDKQYVRDYLEQIQFDKKPPGPELPPAVVKGTTDKYLEAYRLLTGSSLV